MNKWTDSKRIDLFNKAQKIYNEFNKSINIRRECAKYRSDIQFDFLEHVVTSSESKLIDLIQNNKYFKEYVNKYTNIKRLMVYRFPNIYSNLIANNPKYNSKLQPKSTNSMTGTMLNLARAFVMPSLIKKPKQLDVGSIFGIILIVIGIIIFIIGYRGLSENNIKNTLDITLPDVDISELSDCPTIDYSVRSTKLK